MTPKKNREPNRGRFLTPKKDLEIDRRGFYKNRGKKRENQGILMKIRDTEGKIEEGSCLRKKTERTEEGS